MDSLGNCSDFKCWAVCRYPLGLRAGPKGYPLSVLSTGAGWLTFAGGWVVKFHLALQCGPSIPASPSVPSWWPVPSADRLYLLGEEETFNDSGVKGNKSISNVVLCYTCR